MTNYRCKWTSKFYPPYNGRFGFFMWLTKSQRVKLYNLVLYRQYLLSLYAMELMEDIENDGQYKNSFVQASFVQAIFTTFVCNGRYRKCWIYKYLIFNI